MKSFFTIRPYTIVLLILASLSFSLCSGPGKQTGNFMSDTVSINETQRGEAEITLPPLESGEVRVTDEAFGPVINLT